MKWLYGIREAVAESFRRIAAIVEKEFLATLKDRGSQIVLVAPVILQACIFGYGATFNLDRVPWVLWDESRSSLSTEVVQAVTGTGIFDLQRNAASAAAFTESINSGEALVGLHFPADFAKKGELMLIADARNSTTSGIASGYIASIVANLNAERSEGAAGVRLLERYRYNENGIFRYAIIPALILALSMIQVLILSAFSVAREREEGSFDMMLMTPANSVEILIGKAVIPTVIACLQGFLIFAVGVFWFELPFAGSLLTMGVFIFGFALSFVGLGLAVSALADTIQQAIVMMIFFIMPGIILSGLFTSVRAMPEWLQTLTILNPLRYGVVALRAVYFEGAGILDILPLFWPIGLTAVGTLTWATWLFRHKIA